VELVTLSQSSCRLGAGAGGGEMRFRSGRQLEAGATWHGSAVLANPYLDFESERAEKQTGRINRSPTT
jgi:hypothetical protein